MWSLGKTFMISTVYICTHTPREKRSFNDSKVESETDFNQKGEVKVP